MLYRPICLTPCYSEVLYQEQAETCQLLRVAAAKTVCILDVLQIAYLDMYFQKLSLFHVP